MHPDEVHAHDGGDEGARGPDDAREVMEVEGTDDEDFGTGGNWIMVSKVQRGPSSKDRGREAQDDWVLSAPWSRWPCIMAEARRDTESPAAGADGELKRTPQILKRRIARRVKHDGGSSDVA